MPGRPKERHFAGTQRREMRFQQGPLAHGNHLAVLRENGERPGSRQGDIEILDF